MWRPHPRPSPRPRRPPRRPDPQRHPVDAVRVRPRARLHPPPRRPGRRVLHRPAHRDRPVMGPDTADGRRPPVAPGGGGGPAAARELIAQWEATATFTVEELAAW